MSVDPNNRVVKLCAEGIAAEMEGRREEAARLYQEAWEARADDYDACIVAHYLARVQATPAEALHWNQEALRFAETIGDQRVLGFLPSLYLNLGKSHEDIGNADDAKRFYALAEEKAAALPNNEYAETVKHGIAQGLKRMAAAG